MLQNARGALNPRGSSRNRVIYHALVITIGMVTGGALQAVSRQFLPAGPAKEFLTAGLTLYMVPQPINLILMRVTLGPLAIDVSLVSLLGILLAYLVARSLF
jgi:hypothetical protein